MAEITGNKEKEERIEKLNEQIKKIDSGFEAVLLADGNNISLCHQKRQLSQYGWGVTDDFILQRVRYWHDHPDTMKHTLEVKPSTSKSDLD